jgi:hypothetical protein
MPIPYQSRTAAYNSTDAEFRCMVRGGRDVMVFPFDFAEPPVRTVAAPQRMHSRLTARHQRTP